jgi:hypothetical protein
MENSDFSYATIEKYHISCTNLEVMSAPFERASKLDLVNES